MKKRKISENYIHSKNILGVMLFLALGILFGSSITTYATDYSYVEGTQTVNLGAGTYSVEAWGSKGTDGTGLTHYIWIPGGVGGSGGYAKGILTLVSPGNIYIVGTSGTVTFRLNTNIPANNLLIGGAGGTGGDPIFDGDDGYYPGDPGTPGTGSTYAPLTVTSTTAGANGGVGKSRITMVVNQNPVISLSTPTTNQLYSAQIGYKTITITGKVSDPDANNVTVSATINGKTKSTTVNSAPTSPPGSPNFTLNWDVAVDGIAEGSYSSISVSSNDGAGGTASATLTPTLTVDLTAPTVNAPTSGSINNTSFVGTANASDPSTPLQYLFNLNGADQGAWQASSSYTFTGLTASTTYTIKYKAQDVIGNISAYSATINVTTSALPPAPVQGITIMTGALTDIANNGDGRDLRVMFKGAIDESKIQEYRIYVVKTSNAAGFNEINAAALPQAQYMKEPVKGKLRLHLTPIAQTIQDDDGAAIQIGTDYTVFVLSYAKAGNSHKITSLGSIRLDANVPLTKLQAPLVSDTANYGDGRDLTVAFKRPVSELDIQEYRIFVRNISAPVLNLSAANTNTNFKKVLVTDGTKYGFTVTLDNTLLDTRGAGNPIVNGQTYEIYVLAVMSKTGMANILSASSKQIKLSATVPSALPVRSFSAVKVGTGHTGSNISVAFKEPASVTNVQEYRIFICTGAGSLDVTTANGLDNTKYIKADSTGRGAAHTLTLAGLPVFDGTALTAGGYKLYILTVGKTSQYANRLIGPSKVVTLD